MRALAGLPVAFGLAALALGVDHATPSPGDAQETFAADAFHDPVARRLYVSARANWATLDESVVRYAARIDQRIAAAIRTPLKDRVVYHNETAVRAFWDRDYDAVVQVLGTRSRYPGRETAMREGDLDWLEDLPFDAPFEPGGDRLFWGADPDEDVFQPDGAEFWLAHPLAPGADTLYRFRSGDTLTLSLPGGRRLDAIQLSVLPREADVRRISGALWIDPSSGALVRALYRLGREFDAIRDVPELQRADEDDEFRYVPGLFKPWTFDLTMIAVDYALWDFEVWLPRSMRMEGEAAAGILKIPVSMDVSYRIESVALAADEEDGRGGRTASAPVDSAAGGGRRAGDPDGDGLRHAHFGSRAEAMAFVAELLGDRDGTAYELMPDSATPARDRNSLLVVPLDRSAAERSPHLPPPIWEDAPGFASEADLADYARRLAELPAPPIQTVPWSFDWGWARPDFIRYNRVEGPAVGGAVETRLGGRHSLALSGFFGLADLRPKARIEFERSTALRRWTVGAFHEIRATDPGGRYLDLGNSLNALLFGRDEGEYYRATGADLAWQSPEAARASFRLRGYAERQEALGRATDFALFRVFSGDWAFRPNVEADAADEVGLELRLAPWLGSDPASGQLGVEVEGRGAVWRPVGGGAREAYQQASVTLRSLVPFKSSARRRWWIGAEAAGGHTWGSAPAQRSWFMGSAGTLRGHAASALSGPSFLRARLELSSSFSFAASLIAFGDAAWAGERRDFDAGDLLYGIGVGGSVLDGLVRMDLSRGLNGPSRRLRLDLYVDAIL